MRIEAHKKSNQKKYLNKYEVRWLNNYASLVEFKKLHKNIFVGVEYRKSYPVLYRWVKRQRELWAEGKLDLERFEKLNALNFIWNVKDYFWEIFYLQAKAYYEEHSTILMSEKFRKKNKSLATWMNHQREYWLHNKHLNDRKIKKLNAIGFKKRNHRDSWKDNLESLKQFYQEHEHFYTIKNTKLNRWAIMQRNKKKGGLLPKKNIKQLNDIGFPWMIRGYYRVGSR